jgi:multiple sugar transport system permease protein
MSQTMPARPAQVTDANAAERADLATRKRNKRPGSGLWHYVGIAIIIVYCLAPFYWMVVSALRRPNDQFSNALIPAPPSFDNLKAAFSPGNGFARALLNSLIVAGTTTILTLVIGISAAYALARLDFRGKSVALWLIIATSMFPVIAVVVPLLQVFTNIGWINTYQAMIVPSLSFSLPLAIWLLTAFFRQMPFELEEAAQNEFLIAVSVINKNEFKTANVIVSQFTGQYAFDQPFGTQMAAGVVVTIPLVIAVLLFQRRIVEGLTAGGVK